MLAPVLPTVPEPKKLTTGRLIKSLTSFAQRSRSKRNRWLGTGVIDVGTLSWLVTSHIKEIDSKYWDTYKIMITVFDEREV
jgi:hypothetical protein